MKKIGHAARPGMNAVAGVLLMFSLGGPVVEHGPAYRFAPHTRAVFGTAACTSPQVGVSPSGGLFVLAVCGQAPNQTLSLAISQNGGDSFQAPVAVSGVGASLRSGGEASPSLGVTPTAIYALWQQMGAQGGTELLVAREPSPGAPFQEPVRVTDKTHPSFTGFSALGVAPNGDVYVVWLDGRSPTETKGTFSVYVARSSDRGASFGTNVQVASGACPCCRPRVAFGGDGEVYVFWRKVFPGQVRDMVASVSADQGATFASPVRVAEDDWRINGCPESGPVATAAGGRMYVAWMTETDRRRAGVEISWSDDHGKTFARPVLASRGVLDANHPSLSATESGALLVFQGRGERKDGDWSPLRPHLVTISPDGSISRPMPVAEGTGSAAYPVVAAGGAGRAFVVWAESSEKSLAVFLARGRAAGPDRAAPSGE